MSDKYKNYFDSLRKQDEELYSAGADLTPSPEQISHHLIDTDYHGNLYMTDSQKKKRNINHSEVGALELLSQSLNQPDPILPISYYTGRTKQEEKNDALLFSQGFGVNPSTGKSTKHTHSLQTDINSNIKKIPTKNSNIPDKSTDKLINKGVAKKPIEPVKPVVPPLKPTKPKPKPKYDTSKEDDMLKNLMKDGLATIPKRNDKVPDRVLKLEAQQKKDKALMDRVNKPLVSKPKPVIKLPTINSVVGVSTI